MNTLLKNFVADEAGASAAEYALILGVVVVAIGVAAAALGTAVSNRITAATTSINTP